MDLGNGTKKYFADAAGRPIPKPMAAAMVGSPAGLLNPDRYEFYTFDETGDLIKRLMTLEEIQSIIANGETEIGEAGLPNYYHQNLPPDSAEITSAALSTVTEKVVKEAEATDMGELSSVVPGVHDVVMSVQNVLKGELEASKNKIPTPKPIPSPPPPPAPTTTTTTTTTTVASLYSPPSWGMILPGIMSNSGTVSGVANQSTNSSTGLILETTGNLGDTSPVSTGVPSYDTESVTMVIIQELANNSEASTTKKPVSPVSSDISDVEQTPSSSINIQSKLPSLHSSPTVSHISSVPLSSSLPSSPLLSSLTTSPPSVNSSSGTSSLQFSLSFSSLKPSSLLPLTTSHPLATPVIPSALPSISLSQEIPLSPQSSLPTSLPAELSPSPTIASVPTLKPQLSSSNNLYFTMVETLTNPPLVMKNTSNINANEPLQSYESYSKPIIGDTHMTFSETSATTQKPIHTTQLPSSTFRIPSSSLSIVETESADASAISSETQSPLSSLNKFTSKIPLNSENITALEKVAGMPTTIPSQNPSSAVDRTTNNPPVSLTSTALSSSSDTIKPQYENSETSEPAMILISSSESSNHGELSAAQELSHLFTSVNDSFVTHHTSSGEIQSGETTHSPSPATTIISVQQPTTTQSRKPTKPPQTTSTTPDITKIITQPPHSSASSVQTITTNPLEVTKPSSTVMNNKSEGLSAVEILKANVLSTKPTTTELLLSSTTQKNYAENLLMNEASGFVPVEIESPVGAAQLPATANGNLDVPPELAESLLGVLSQVADVEGTATTIDYGEGNLYIFHSSTTTTQHDITEDISSTESGNHSSPVNVVNNSSHQTNITPLDNNLLTESRNNVHSMSTTEKLAAATLHIEASQQNADTVQTPTTPSLSNLHINETAGDQTTGSISVENTSNFYEQDTTEDGTIESVDKYMINDPVNVDKTELEQDEKGDHKNVEGSYTAKIVSLEDQKKVDKEIIKEKVEGSTSVELLSSASNSNEALNTNFEILEKEPYDEGTATSILGETDSDFTSNVMITTEAAGSITVGSDSTEQKEDTLSSITELTTEQPNLDIHNSNTKSGVNTESITTLEADENSRVAEDEGQNISAITTTPESIVSRDKTESSIQTTKENIETSAGTLTKYKKDDIEMAEETMQGKLTLKPSDESKADKISIDNNSSVQGNEAYDDTQRLTTEIQESITHSGTTEDAMQKEELNVPISTTVNTAFIQNTEMSTDASVTDKEDEIIHINVAKTDVNFAESSGPTTSLPPEDKSEKVIDYKISSFEMMGGMHTEGFTTEVISRYETELTTLDSKFTIKNEDSSSFWDEEPKVTTDAPVTEYDNSEATTVASPETKIENSFTEMSLEKESEINVKDINHWESDGTGSTVSPEKGLESDITKKTAGNTSWTKLWTLSPSHANNNNKVTDGIAVSSTRRPTTVISTLTTTAEDVTIPTEILKFSGLNKEKVKDTKTEVKLQEPEHPQSYVIVDLEPAPQENLGLEATSAGLEEDIRNFAELCNELAFRLWASVTAKGFTISRSVVMSPFAVTSLLAMVFLGARGPTSGQMNDILRLDDMVTFNPHQVFRNVTESLALPRTQGITTAAFVRELYSDRVSKVELHTVILLY